MNFSSLVWWQWLMVFSVPPLIVLLYFLKLKRQPLEIPSTYLWQRTIEDLHVNSIWQRLRQNLLLFLQLLLMLFAIFALLRPSMESTRFSGERLIFLLDTSASMSATDLEPTRLDAAKNQLIDIVDNEMSSGAVAMLVSFSDRAIVEQPFTDNKRLLRARIQAVQQTERPSVLDEALRVAAGLANPGRSASDETDVASADAMPATLLVYSDGQFRTVPDFSMGNLSPEYFPMGAMEENGVQLPENVGIIAFNSATNPADNSKVQVFAQFENFTSSGKVVTCELTLDDKMIDAQEVDIDANSSTGVEFTLDAVDLGVLKLVITDDDDFAADNVAYAPISKPRKANVLIITPRNDALEMVMATPFLQQIAEVSTGEPNLVTQESYKKQADSGGYDLIIYDQCAPETMPQANTVFIGSLPPLNWTAEEAAGLPQVIDADLSHPLLEFVELGNVIFAECNPLNVPKGGLTLVDSQHGTMMGIAPRDGFEDLVLGFELVGQDEEGNRVRNTNWVIRPSFPVFVHNVVSYLGGTGVGARETIMLEPGTNITLRTSVNATEIEVESPTGQRLKIKRGPQNTFVYGNTERKGVYKIREGDEKDVSQQFAVNLFDTVESDIRPNANLLTTKEEIKGQHSVVPARFELWKFLLGASLVILMLEWYIYNRRVYV
ncbi:MAG: BatA and WFA domain-containing protein [Planctomycetales bacterium]|nr:BatA and WFA domain-containing protein [Planctomycetales bacterium]